jgi:hypothetical protein
MKFMKNTIILRFKVRMKPMINIVTFKWNRILTGFQLPSICDYTSKHVNILHNSIKRNITVPYRFICITDDPTGIDSDIEIVELWDKYKSLGGCYNRLYLFSKDMKSLIGDRILSIDLDVVITANIDEIVSRTEDFVMNEYNIEANKNATHQYYNGSLVLMNAGARSKVWKHFHNPGSLEVLEHRRKRNELVGTDQAWISHLLGPTEETFTPEYDGVYDFRKIPVKHILPNNAKMVFFHGKRDPSTLVHSYEWIREHWRL